MKMCEVVKSTKNRSEFNKSYKKFLQRTGKIKCSFCPYHSNDNRDNVDYTYVSDSKIKFPNWKLISKNPKQWMVKTLKHIIQ
jgi:hypothetical protein